MSAYITYLHEDIRDQKDELEYKLGKIYKDTDRIDNIEFRLKKCITLLDDTESNTRSNISGLSKIESTSKKLESRLGKLDQQLRSKLDKLDGKFSKNVNGTNEFKK